MLWCRTLGEAALYTDASRETPLLRAGKAIAVLTYLGLQPRHREHRDRLVELFWPGTANGNGRHCLRQTLYRLPRAADGAALIEANETTVQLTGPVMFDCLEGERALTEGRIDQAIELLRGSFLPGIVLPGSGDVAEWAEVHDSRFRAGFERAANAAITRALASGDPLHAVALAEELVSLNPIDDRRVHALMRSLDRAGRARQALIRYAEFEQRLRIDDGDSPSRELQSYAGELQRSLDLVAPEPAPVLPFVGRTDAWAALDRAWADIESGTCVTVLIEGDGGLGKTRLIEEFARRTAARGALRLAAKSYEIESALPFALIGDLVRSAPDTDSRALPDLTAVHGNGDAALREELVAWLEREAARQPLLVACDDLHWGDEASLQLLHPLTHRLVRSRVLIVCTYRPLELSPAARRFTVSLVGEHLGRLVPLRPLSVDDVAEILDTMATFEDPATGARLARALHGHTAGNPLFLAELLSALEYRGDLTQRQGRWVPSPDLANTVLPKTMRKVLADRVDALPTHLRDVLELMCLAADAVHLTTVARALNLSDPAAQAALSDLARFRLVRSERSGSWSAGHDELRLLVSESIPDDRRRRLHRAIGTALEAEGVPGPATAGRLARHFELAGDVERAESYSRPRPKRSTRPVLRRFGVAHLVTAVALTGTAVLGSYAVRSPAGGVGMPERGYVQGAIYVLREDRTTEGRGVQIMQRLEWGPANQPSRLTPAQDTDLIPPALITTMVHTGDRTHGKIFRVSGRDTVQVTFGNTDDGPALWSPDRRLIAVQRGWRSGRLYRFNLVVVDTAGSEVWRVTEGQVHDGLLAWSPDGAHLAFQRTVDGTTSLWIVDPDGSRPEDLSQAFDLTSPPSQVAFAPDGTHLAVTYRDSGNLDILDLRHRSRRTLYPSCDLVGTSLAWSPDGRWMAVLCGSDTGLMLSALPTEGTGNLIPLAATAPGVRLRWVGDASTHVSVVRLPDSSIVLPPTRGRTIRVAVTDNHGAPIKADLRWSTGDTNVARVDPTGFVRGLRPGATWIAASVGGLYGDTTPVIVPPGSPDTVLFEDWSRGIDARRWETVGSPPPVVIEADGPEARPALLNNGDENWPSGLLSTEQFDAAAGITLEFAARLPFTGDHWQELEAAFVRREVAVVAGERNASGRSGAVWISGPSFEYPSGIYGCGADGDGVREPFTPADHRWYRFTIQLRPDNVVECYVDGVLRGTALVPLPQRAPRLAVYVGGRSEYTRILYGPVLVARGLLR